VIDCNVRRCCKLDPTDQRGDDHPGNEGITREAAALRRAGDLRPLSSPHRRDHRCATHPGAADGAVSLHSFTPVYAGIARPWHIGTLYQRDRVLPPLLLEAVARGA